MVMKKAELLERIESLEASRDVAHSVNSRIEILEAKVAQTHEYIKSMHKELESFAENRRRIGSWKEHFAGYHGQIEQLEKAIETLQRAIKCSTPTEPKKLGQRKPSRRPAKPTR